MRAAGAVSGVSSRSSPDPSPVSAGELGIGGAERAGSRRTPALTTLAMLVPLDKPAMFVLFLCDKGKQTTVPRSEWHCPLKQYSSGIWKNTEV